jgi:NAD(P)-dependent dehydrogenase (short-subunit alcohol dehydrogenase family)
MDLGPATSLSVELGTEQFGANGEAEAVANLFLLLASARARYHTGATIQADGGAV